MVRVIALCLLVGVHGLRMQDHKNKMEACRNQYATKLDAVRKGMGDNIRAHPLTAVKTSDRSLVLGAGPGTTATRSLALAFKQLGLKTSHWSPKLRHDQSVMGWKNGRPGPKFSKDKTDKCLMALRTKDYTHLPENIEAYLDTPVSENFINYYLAYPNSKVVNSLRPGLAWAHKRRAHAGSLLPVQEPCGLYLKRSPYNFQASEEGQLLDLHNEFVKCVVPPENYFEFNVWTDPKQRTQGLMEELSKFLNKASPRKSAFPRGFKVLGELEEVEGEEGEANQKCHLTLDPAAEYEASEVFPVIQDFALAGCELSALSDDEIDDI